MSGLIIPIPRSLVDWRQRTALEGVDFILSFAWNERFDRWIISMASADGVDLRTGIAIDVDMPLFIAPTDDMPSGIMVAIDTLGKKEPPTFDDFGERVILKYYTQEQYAAIPNTNTADV